MWQNSKTQNVTTQKLKMGQNSKTQNVIKPENSKCDITQKLIMWLKLKTQNMTKLKNSNSDQKNYFWQKSFVKNNLTPQHPMRCIRGSHLRYCDVFWQGGASMNKHAELAKNITVFLWILHMLSQKKFLTVIFLSFSYFTHA